MRFHLISLLFVVLTCGCAAAKQDLSKLCTAADMAGKSLTVTVAVTREAIVIQAEAAKAKCTQTDPAAKVACDNAAVDAVLAAWKSKVDALNTAVGAQDSLADAMQSSCKAAP